jgi:hypothetical protein
MYECLKHRWSLGPSLGYVHHISGRHDGCSFALLVDPAHRQSRRNPRQLSLERSWSVTTRSDENDSKCLGCRGVGSNAMCLSRISINVESLPGYMLH